jgi:hypothetical protein
MQFESDFRFDVDDSFSFGRQPVPFSLTTMTSKATAWPVYLEPSAEALPRHPPATISSAILSAGLKRKHSSSDIRKTTYPTKQYTSSKTTGNYTISRDCTAGFEVHNMQLLADFGRKYQGEKNYSGVLGITRSGPDVTYQPTDAIEIKASQVADSGFARSHSRSPVGDRTIIQAQQLRQNQIYRPRPQKDIVYVPNRMGKAESSSSKEARDKGKPCKFCGYIPQCGILRFEDYMARHMMSQHPEKPKEFRCPHPGCASQFSRRDNMRKHQERMGHYVKDEDLTMQKRQRVR